MAFVIVTANQITCMAGENVDSTGNTATNQELLELMAISQLCGWSRYNWADNYSTLNTDVKHVISEYISRFIAVQLIIFNMAGYTTRIEAEDMINVHLARMNEIKELVMDQKWVTYATGA